MATKLKHLKVTSVDFVDEGANPDAHIRLYKRRDEAAAEPGTEDPNSDGAGFFKRLSSSLAKMFGLAQEPESAETEVQKNSASFDEAYGEAKERRVCDEVWDVCLALNQSLCSILGDGALDGAAARTAMLESLEEFDSVAKDSIEQWSAGKTANVVLKNVPMDDATRALAKAAVDALNEQIEKHGHCENDDVTKDTATKKDGDKPEGEDDMKIDKSKMTHAERAFYEEIEKRYGTDEAGTPAGQTPPPAEGTPAPAAPAEAGTPAPADTGVAKSANPNPNPAPGYAPIDPRVQAELDSLRKFRESYEDRELHDVAKRYTLIGKKEDELFPILKSMKAAGGNAYDSYIAVLDESMKLAESSGTFSEIGKSGGEAPDAWARAEAKAAEIMKSKNVTKAQAIDEVLLNDPALRAECEKEG